MGVPTYVSLFSGIGGLDLAVQHYAGWRARAYVEWEAHSQACLIQRFRDGLLTDAPIWDDAQTFDGRAFEGATAVVAGFPCQPFSKGGRQRQENDPRNMWPATIRIVEEVRPELVLLENVPRLRAPRRKRGDVLSTRRKGGDVINPSYFGRILGDLANVGYDAVWGCVSSADVGAPHGRQRLWVLAYSDRGRLEKLREAYDHHRRDARRDDDDGRRPVVVYPPPPRHVEAWGEWLREGGPLPGIRRGAARPPRWKQRLISAGNCVHPQVAAKALYALMGTALENE